MSRVIALMTDFGWADPYLGIMKGVVLSRAPGAAVIDLCHDVPPQDIVAGALALEAATGFFPPATVFLAVVDPGVGGERAAIAIETERSFLVGPDNGLFTLFLRREPARRIVRITNPAHHLQPVSPTFHGRDIFAPAAAHLAGGGAIDDLGDTHSEAAPLCMPHPIVEGDNLAAHVLAQDRFGNLVTDLSAEELNRWRGSDDVAIRAGSLEIGGVLRTFAEAEAGALLAYVGSGGRLEIGLRDGSAAAHTGLTRGATILLRRVGSGPA